jgi:hypothetical protein
MPNRPVQPHLRVLDGGRQGPPSETDIRDAAAVVARDLAAVEPRSAADEAEQWPNIDDVSRWRQLVWKTAYRYALDGGKRRQLLGTAGSLTKLLRAVEERATASIDRLGHQRRLELERRIGSSGARAKAAVDLSQVQDRKAKKLHERIDALDGEIACVAEAEEQLTPGQRRGRLVGREAVAAVAATGLIDASAFVLTINGLGGSLWLRLSIAVSIALALNVAVLALGRTLVDIWRMWNRASGLRRALVVGGGLGMLGFFLVRALISAGEFRQHALPDLDRGVPTDPHFLVWVGLTGTFGATVALGWWRYSTEGDRLMRRRRKLEHERAELAWEQRAPQPMRNSLLMSLSRTRNRGETLRLRRMPRQLSLAAGWVIVTLSRGTLSALAVFAVMRLGSDGAVWAGVAGAFGGTVAAGWWHYASEGSRLAHWRRNLAFGRVTLVQELSESNRRAAQARDMAFQIVQDAKRAQADLHRLPDAVDELRESRRAETQALIDLANVGFGEGTQRRKAQLGRSVRTDVADIDRAVDEAVADLWRGSADIR